MRNVRYLDKLRRAAVKRLGGLMPDEAFYGGPKSGKNTRTPNKYSLVESPFIYAVPQRT